MIKLSATTMTLEAKLGGAVSSAQLPVTVSYSEYDDTNGTLALASSDTATNSTTAVTILAAPASGKVRTLDYLAIYNADSASATVTVQLNDNSTIRIQVVLTLTTGQTLQYTRDGGWRIANAPFSISGTVTVAGTVTADAGTGPWPVTDNGSSLTVDNAGTFAVQAAATLAAETTKVIGTVNIAASQTVGLVAGSAVIGHVILDASSAVIGHTIVDSGTITAVTSITNVVHVDDNSSSLTVDAPVGAPVFVRLSDGSAAISTLPVSLASVPSHAVTNAGTFAVQATLAAETTKVIGTINISASQTVGLVAGSAVIGHVIVDAGSAVIGHVIVDSGTITVSSGAITATTNADAALGPGTAPSKCLVAGAYRGSRNSVGAAQTTAIQCDQVGNLITFPGTVALTGAAWTSSTALNTTQIIFSIENAGVAAVPSALVQLVQTSTLTAGAVTFEVTYDSTNWVTVSADAVIDPTSATQATISLPYTVQASTNKAFLLLPKGAQGLRAKLSTVITGSGSVTIYYTLLPYAAVQQATLGAGSAVIGAVTQSGTWNVVTTNAGTFAVQAAEADGANVTLGSKADAKSTATDTTAITVMQVLKQISASVQAPPSQAVTNAGTFAVQAAATLAAETTKVIGTVNIAASQTVGLAAGSAVIGHVIVDSGTVTTVSTVTSLSQWAGTAIDTNIGTKSAGTLRTVAAGCATGTQSTVAGSATSVTILASNTSRTGASVFNDSTAILYLRMSSSAASTTTYTVQLSPNAYFEVPSGYNGAITGLWSSATGNARVTEYS